MQILQKNSYNGIDNVFFVNLLNLPQIVLHLSDNNSNATEFIHGIERLYPEIEITAATNGLSLTFNKNPY